MASEQYLAILRRRELVKLYKAQGLLKSDIVDRLTKDRIFPSTFTESQKYRIVNTDLKAIAKEDKEIFAIALEDAELARSEYLGRQQMLYAQAVLKGDIIMARSLSRDIAVASGVNVDEPIRVETDFGSLMRGNFASAREKAKLELQKRHAIDLAPSQEEPAILVPVQNGHGASPPEHS